MRSRDSVPTVKDLVVARRALTAIGDDRIVAESDALVLRLWAGPKQILRPLEEIAREIIRKDGRTAEPPIHS